MTIRESLEASGIARADAEVLLAQLLGKERTWLFAHADDALPQELASEWNDRVKRRKSGEPVAYICGTKEFFGRPFEVHAAVLIPRPATETLTSMALDMMDNGSVGRDMREIDSGIAALSDIWGEPEDARCVADIGTGSGCIAITLGLARPHLRVIATDSSEKALDMARRNARHLKAPNVEFRLGDALAPLQDVTEPFLIVSNPPYIPEDLLLDKDVMDFEPHSALFSGPDGADIIRKIISQAKAHPHCIGYLLECRMEQARMILD